MEYKPTLVTSIKNHIRRVHFDGLLYITNRIIAKIPFHFIRLLFYRFCLGCKIGRESRIFMDAWFDSKNNFSLGQNSIINQKCRLDNRAGIIIGNNVSISAEVCILTADHDLQSLNCIGRKRSVTIEDYVFIGTRAMILPGVKLGKGSAVAAGAVVTKNVDPYEIVAGIPAKSIGTRPTNLNYVANYLRLFS